MVQKQMIRLLTNGQKVNSSLTLHHSACVVHLTSSHHPILSPQIITRRGSIVQWEILRLHLHTFYYNILLELFYFITVVNLLLCLVNKLNFIIGMSVEEKTMYGELVLHVVSFRHPRGSWDISPMDERV